MFIENLKILGGRFLNQVFKQAYKEYMKIVFMIFKSFLNVFTQKFFFLIQTALRFTLSNYFKFDYICLYNSMLEIFLNVIENGVQYDFK